MSALLRLRLCRTVTFLNYLASPQSWKPAGCEAVGMKMRTAGAGCALYTPAPLALPFARVWTTPAAPAGPRQHMDLSSLANLETLKPLGGRVDATAHLVRRLAAGNPLPLP
jgi:hypothetical protein